MTPCRWGFLRGFHHKWRVRVDFKSPYGLGHARLRTPRSSTPRGHLKDADFERFSSLFFRANTPGIRAPFRDPIAWEAAWGHARGKRLVERCGSFRIGAREGA